MLKHLFHLINETVHLIQLQPLLQRQLSWQYILILGKKGLITLDIGRKGLSTLQGHLPLWSAEHPGCEFQEVDQGPCTIPTVYFK